MLGGGLVIWVYTAQGEPISRQVFASGTILPGKMAHPVAAAFLCARKTLSLGTGQACWGWAIPLAKVCTFPRTRNPAESH